MNFMGEGFCISSSVALVLRDIFLASMDKRVLEGINQMRVLRIFRYVDDFLGFVDDHSGIYLNDVTKVVKLFDAMSDELNFTRSLPGTSAFSF